MLNALMLFLMAATATVFSVGAWAQDYIVEVVVADPGAKQRASAYWLALNRVMQRNMPEGSITDSQRQEVLRDPARYVQSFRYRAYNETTDVRRLSTRQIREGAVPDSVIVVTFPATLPGNIQRRFQVQPLQEQIVTAGSGRILSLIAVEQSGDQFLIGGNAAKKFQARMIQLGAANNLTFEFPVLDDQDLAIISPANVLFKDQSVLDAMVQKYQSSGRISGALVRIGESSWQSDWQYDLAANKNGSLSLTTKSLDEALLTAVTEIANDGASLPAGMFGGSFDFKRAGVSIRVENIDSLDRHQQVLALLRTIDDSTMVEGLEPGVTVYRALNTDLLSLQQRLSTQPALTSLPDYSGEAALGYRLR